MPELRQDIFPVCSFGRAENVYYQSADSLCPRDLTLEEIISLVREHSAPIFPSHVLDRADLELLIKTFQSTNVRPRVQIALGREWEELIAPLKQVINHGWGVDVLIDRPLTMLSVPTELSTLTDWRWIACPLRFFDLQVMKRSFLEFPIQRQVLWSFFEPRHNNTLLLNPDEVILAKRKIEDADFLVLTSSLSTCSGFYQHPTLEVYQDKFTELGPHRKTRGFIEKWLKNFPQVFSFLVFLGTLFFSEGVIKWINRVVLIPSYWLLHRIVGAIKLSVSRVYWLFHTIIMAIYLQLNRLFWAVHSLATWIFLKCNSAFWWLRPKAARAFFIITWPARKVFWFGRFQFEKRVEPALKKFLPND